MVGKEKWNENAEAEKEQREQFFLAVFERKLLGFGKLCSSLLLVTIK